MVYPQNKDPDEKKPKPITYIQYFLLVALFVLGLFAIVATSPSYSEEWAILTNPHPTVSGPYSSQINAKLAALHEAKVKYGFASGKLFSGWEDPIDAESLSWEITRIETELKELRAKAAKAMQSETGGCFPADMWVLTEDGAKPIAQIKVGDRVLSFSEGGQQVPADVLKTYTDRNYHYFLINDKIKVTALHRFFTSGGWKRARELRIGDRIKLNGGAFEKIVSIEWYAENLYVYNLTISKNHNFYISPDGKSGYLVHNTPGAGAGAGSK
jgi:hypothetical protein